eukprot:15349111-Alexandrium_andersonii.AAC.1
MGTCNGVSVSSHAEVNHQLPDAVCQFNGVPLRNTYHEMTDKHLVPIALGRRWADYFNNGDEFYVDKQHFSFKAGQMAFRDHFGTLPMLEG